MNEEHRDNLNTDDSVYSYSYRDREQNTATHEGDYDARQHDRNRAWSQGSSNRSYYNPQDGSVYQQSYTSGQNYASGQTPKREKKSGGFGKMMLKCVALALVFGLVAGGVFQGVARIGNPTLQAKVDGGYAGDLTDKDSDNGITHTNQGGSLDSTSVSTAVTVTDVSDIVENVMPSIVSITSMSQVEYYNWFGQSQVYETPGAGSGIIVGEDDTNLYIVTNNHVVADSTSLTVTFIDDETASAMIKGSDPNSDLAVIYVAKADVPDAALQDIKIATLGDSDNLKVGASAIAIGNALGYGQSVTTGVISALGREVTSQDSSTGVAVTNELIQTDAAINPGNSGGALLNMNGEVIGINSMKYSDTSVEGMGYAIPINTADPIINDLITREKVDQAKSAYLGISGVDVNAELSKTYNMPEGIFVAQVAQGSAAEQAGLKEGDIITAFDGKSVRSMEALKELLQYYEAGTTVDITVQYAERGGYVEDTVSVTLGSKVD